MTATAHRSAASKRVPVYDSDGQVIATVDAARSRWLGGLLAECDAHHVYLLDTDDPWVGCPVCEVA